MDNRRKGPADGFAGFVILPTLLNPVRRGGLPLRSFRIAVLWPAFVLICACAGRSAGWNSAALPGVPAETPPKISSIQPSQASPGSRITVKITGENFLAGAYVSFSDPAVHVLATRRASGTELDVDISVGQIAKPESVVLYVSNPSGASAQTAFAIALATAEPAQASEPSSPNAARCDPG